MLTDAKVRALAAAAPATRQDIADGAVKGLMLRVGPRGAPSWTLRYAITGKGGVTARGKGLASRRFYRIGLGDCPALSIRDARARASAILAQAARGEDPIAQLEEQATVRKGSVAELAEEFLNTHALGKLRSARKAEWIVRDYIVPRPGEKAPQKVRRLDIVAVLDDLARHGTPTAALDTRKWLSIFFSLAFEKGHVEANPVLGVKPPLKAKSRKRVLSIDEARAVWMAASAEPYPSGTLACLLMLTAASLREFAHARVNWLDQRNACKSPARPARPAIPLSSCLYRRRWRLQGRRHAIDHFARRSRGEALEHRRAASSADQAHAGQQRAAITRAQVSPGQSRRRSASARHREGPLL
jgi:hypothetical protein